MSDKPSDCGPEYDKNERRLRFAMDCLDHLTKARMIAPPSVAPHIETAIAAAIAAVKGYSFRDDELYAEATKVTP